MSIIGSNILAGASGQGGAGYTIENSLRFRSSASAYLSRTPASAGNRKTWTWSGWVKRGALGDAIFFSAGTATSDVGSLQFVSDSIRVFDRVSSSNSTNCLTNAVFRDTSAWYHVVVVYDNTQATASDRVKVYVNAISQSFNSPTYPNQNYASGNFNKAVQHNVGRAGYSSGYFDGYLTEVNFIDGQALDPSSFGEYNEDTGVWQPVAYAGAYGTNGFYLPFSDATTTTTLAADASGNGNDWTPNGISLTAGVTYDSMTDTPTIYADGGNYAVLNPLNTTNGAVAQGNLYWSSSGASGFLCTGTIAFDIADTVNKYYFEIQLAGGDGAIGIAPTTLRGSDTGRAGSYSYYTTGSKYSGVSASAYGAAFGAPNIIGVAVGAGKITFYKNGVSQGDAFTGLTGLFVPMLVEVSGTFNANFGQRPFAYTPPTGFLPLHTGNLPDSTIVDGSKYFDAVLYTGTGAEQSITGLEFQPDFVWGKERSTANSHALQDVVRGSTFQLFSNLTNAETDRTEGVKSFDSNGFTLGTHGMLNDSGESFVAWNWKANGAGVSNTDGSITSTVSANPTAGFSIVTYTGNGTSGATIGHGLGVAPDVILTKSRDSATNWLMYHSANTAAPATDYLRLNTTSATADDNTVWNDTSPTSSVFSVGTAISSNGSGDNIIGYCFSEVEGYSKFGSYTGNGSTDGPFVYLGFRPAFVMFKNASGAGNSWLIFDTTRTPANQEFLELKPDSSAAEAPAGSWAYFDFLSNGFKPRTTSTATNASGQTIIYMAFAENPFKNSLAR